MDGHRALFACGKEADVWDFGVTLRQSITDFSMFLSLDVPTAFFNTQDYLHVTEVDWILR